MNAFKNSTSWALILRGLLFVLFGALSIFLQSPTIYGPMFYLGLLFAITGIIYIVLAVMMRKNNSAWPWWLLWGLFDMLLGSYVLMNTERATDIFTNIIGGWAIVMSVAIIIAAIRDKRYRVILLINALVSLAFGFLILFNPFPAIIGLNFLIGLYALLFGMMVIYLGYMFKKEKPEVTQI